jgi:hypothetical protein
MGQAAVARPAGAGGGTWGGAGPAWEARRRWRLGQEAAAAGVGGGSAAKKTERMSPHGFTCAHKRLIPVGLRSGRQELSNPRRPTLWSMGVKLTPVGLLSDRRALNYSRRLRFSRRELHYPRRLCPWPTGITLTDGNH